MPAGTGSRRNWRNPAAGGGPLVSADWQNIYSGISDRGDALHDLRVDCIPRQPFK